MFHKKPTSLAALSSASNWNGVQTVPCVMTTCCDLDRETRYICICSRTTNKEEFLQTRNEIKGQRLPTSIDIAYLQRPTPKEPQHPSAFTQSLHCPTFNLQCQNNKHVEHMPTQPDS